MRFAVGADIKARKMFLPIIREFLQRSSICLNFCYIHFYDPTFYKCTRNIHLLMSLPFSCNQFTPYHLLLTYYFRVEEEKNEDLWRNFDFMAFRQRNIYFQRIFFSSFFLFHYKEQPI